MTRIINLRDGSFPMLRKIKEATGLSYAEIVHRALEVRLVAVGRKEDFAEEVMESIFPQVWKIDGLLNARGLFRDAVSDAFEKYKAMYKEQITRAVMVV